MKLITGRDEKAGSDMKNEQLEHVCRLYNVAEKKSHMNLKRSLASQILRPNLKYRMRYVRNCLR